METTSTLAQALNEIATTLRIAELLESCDTYKNAIQDAKELTLNDLEK